MKSGFWFNFFFIKLCDIHNIWILTAEPNISFWIFVACTQCCVIIKKIFWNVLQRVLWKFWYEFFCNNKDCVYLTFGDICRCHFSRVKNTLLKHWLKNKDEILLKYRNISHKNWGFFFLKKSIKKQLNTAFNYLQNLHDRKMNLLYIRDECKCMNVIKQIRHNIKKIIWPEILG